jgi:tryptophan halogenase
MNITVLGGGTAGWLTALLVKRFYPTATVRLVESEEIGILGAGEGTVPNFTTILELINIPLTDLVKECEATIKTGIRFKNWNGDNKDYFHEFGSASGLDHREINLNSLYPNLAYSVQTARGEPFDNLKFSKKLADANKVPFRPFTLIAPGNIDKFSTMAHLGSYALHFNARLLATYLKKVAVSRGIVRVEGKFKSTLMCEQGNITSLVLEDARQVPCDFVFDCSGFARLLIGKTFDTKWIGYNDHLPLDTALPFFIPHDGKDIAPETGAIALKYGWMWKIPVQNRYGCGYVFNSAYINNEQALQEVEEYLGHSVTSPTTFKFKAGTYESTVVKNCMAVGLAQSFVEPLEATSIMISCINLVEFLQSDGVSPQPDSFKLQFNSSCLKRNSDVVDFLYLHYLTKRDDSPFWKEFRSATKMIDSVNDRLTEWSETAASTIRHEGHGIWATDNWLQIADGLGLLSQEAHANRVVNLGLLDKIGGQLHTLDVVQNMNLNSCLDHFEFLNNLKQG